MSGNYFLLDTNIIIAVFAKDLDIIDKVNRAKGVFVPSIAIGELYYGVYKSQRVEDNLMRLTQFVATSAILRCDAITAKHYGEIKNKLRAKARPIPENDIWIAALAFQYDLTLISRDAHFKHVDQIRLELCINC